MTYALLVYDRDDALAGLSEQERAAIHTEYENFARTVGIKESTTPRAVRFDALVSGVEIWELQKVLHRRASWKGCKLSWNRKAPIGGAFFKPSSGLEPETPSLPCARCGNWSQPTATVFA